CLDFLIAPNIGSATSSNAFEGFRLLIDGNALVLHVFHIAPRNFLSEAIRVLEQFLGAFRIRSNRLNFGNGCCFEFASE
ncbi:MAG: hypothetical protein ACTIOG_14585, partial [Pseudomonas helleri]|uniref:hypothetical protein n=1 Tax=Pseudomonas lundensis TaxID=86185 RepID=UPI001D019860